MNHRKVGLKSIGRWVFIVVAVSMFIACGGDEKSETKVAKRTTSQKETHLYFDGEIYGNVNGKSFMFRYEESKNAEVRTRGDTREFSIKFIADGNIIVIIVNPYHGTGSYDKELNVIWQSMKNVGKLLNITDKRMILEDENGKILSDFTLTAHTAEGKEIKIVGTFKIKKRENELMSKKEKK